MARILIVEDEDNIAVALEFLMTRDGHSHRRLASGRGAIEAIRQDHPDLVLLDIMLPDISGYQIIEEMRADPALRDVRVLMMTVPPIRKVNCTPTSVSVGRMALGSASRVMTWFSP